MSAKIVLNIARNNFIPATISMISYSTFNFFFFFSLLLLSLLFFFHLHSNFINFSHLLYNLQLFGLISLFLHFPNSIVSSISFFPRSISLLCLLCYSPFLLIYCPPHPSSSFSLLSLTPSTLLYQSLQFSSVLSSDDLFSSFLFFSQLYFSHLSSSISTSL